MGCRWCPFRFLWQELVSCSQSLIIFLPPINTTSSHFLPFPSRFPHLSLSLSSLVLLRFSLPLLVKRTKFRCTLWQPPKHGRFNKRELQILGFLKRGVKIPESRKEGKKKDLKDGSWTAPGSGSRENVPKEMYDEWWGWWRKWKE